MRLRPVPFGAFFIMKFLEKDLEQIICESGMEELRKRGLGIYGKLFRQVKIGNYGIADLITVRRPYYEDELNITIYELKKDTISISAFLQAVNYAKGIQKFMGNKYPEIDYRMTIALIGHNIDTSGSFCYLPEIVTGHCELKMYTYEYKVDGVQFVEHNNYHLVEAGF